MVRKHNMHSAGKCITFLRDMDHELAPNLAPHVWVGGNENPAASRRA